MDGLWSDPAGLDVPADDWELVHGFALTYWRVHR